MYYAYYLAQRLAIVEQNNVELFAISLEVVANESNQTTDTGLSLEIFERTNDIPVILEGEDGILEGYNFSDAEIETDQTFLTKERDKIIKRGFEPIKGPGGYASKIYYKNSKLYTLITYFPLVQMLLLGSFILLGYFLVNSTKRAEQNRVWAGMAKETAHQLGTPLSAIVAWIEILKDRAKDEDDMEIVNELSKDVDRLELVADRFSKIGSTPSLESTDMNVQVLKSVKYMERRMPQKVSIDFEPIKENSSVKINRHLFDWVVENLIRNAITTLFVLTLVIQVKVFPQANLSQYFSPDILLRKEVGD